MKSILGRACLILALYPILSGFFPANRILAQCPDGYSLKLATGSSAVPSSGVDLILIHGYVIEDAGGQCTSVLLRDQIGRASCRERV